MYHDLGTKVTLLEYLPQIVPLEDREVSQALERSFTRRGMTVMTNARFDAAKVEVTKDGICLEVGPEGKEPKEVRAEQLLVAAGRATNVEDIGLETTKIETDRGFVKVDGRMRTKEPHVYAIGDIVGGLMLAHTAGHEGIVAAHTIAGDKDVHPIDYVKQPRATYCRPEIASIGLTQQQAEERGPADQGRQGPVPGDRQGDHRRRVRGVRQGHRQQGDRRDARDPPDRPARHRPHRRGLGRVRAGGGALGDRRRDPRPPDPVGGPRRGGDGGRRPVDQLLMAVTDELAKASSALGADLGLSTDDLLEMYRLVALARAVDERMWILNRAGRIPFVISGQGHEGAQVGDRLGAREGQGLDRPVLPLDRDLPDVRDERRATS